MKNKVIAAVVLIVLGSLSTFFAQRFACNSSRAYKELRVHYEAKIDSLQGIINARNERIAAIEDSIKHTESEIEILEKSIQNKDRQITHYKGKGRFDYVQSMDSLQTELNRLIKLRLAELDSTANRSPR